MSRQGRKPGTTLAAYSPSLESPHRRPWLLHTEVLMPREGRKPGVALAAYSPSLESPHRRPWLPAAYSPSLDIKKGCLSIPFLPITTGSTDLWIQLTALVSHEHFFQRHSVQLVGMAGTAE